MGGRHTFDGRSPAALGYPCSPRCQRRGAGGERRRKGARSGVVTPSQEMEEYGRGRHVYTRKACLRSECCSFPALLRRVFGGGGACCGWPWALLFQFQALHTLFTLGQANASTTNNMNNDKK